MKKFMFLVFLVGMIITACNTENKNTSKIEEVVQGDVIVFDSLRAAKVGADEYGMKQYVMAFLKRGPNRDRPKEAADKLQRAHLDNIGKLAEAGKLVLAGPFLNDGEIRGIYVFDVKTVDEARALTETDPAIQAGSLEMELIPWYGSAALVEIGDIHKRIAKTKI